MRLAPPLLLAEIPSVSAILLKGVSVNPKALRKELAEVPEQVSDRTPPSRLSMIVNWAKLMRIFG
ncbi:hypothetical protein [Ktedonobacter racemifer]|uniref:Uncharacterized protein n=1 Tax=Ktedonobacter racemifer DSM 44963 TaxID=485913 RepID=D6U0J4_KTERA|nr:hypothetical protein [Ktedonobacter racemifer]EFH82334.1 hypothetical protein Krac_3140 [Ktedonobacter racemifer DSM 44963]